MRLAMEVSESHDLEKEQFIMLNFLFLYIFVIQRFLTICRIGIINNDQLIFIYLYTHMSN